MKIKKVCIVIVTIVAIAAFKVEAVDFSSFYKAGVELIRENNTKKGRAQLERIIVSDDAPDDISFKASLWVAHSLLEEDKEDEAIDAIWKIFRIKDYEKYEEEALSDVKNMKEVLKLYQKEKKRLGKKLDNIEKNIQKAQKFFDGKKFSRAKNTLQEVLSVDPDNPEGKKLAEKIKNIEKKIENELQEIHALVKVGDINQARLKINNVINMAPYDEKVSEINEQIEEEERKIRETYNNIDKLLEESHNYYLKREYRKARGNLKKIFEYEDEAKIMRHIKQPEPEEEGKEVETEMEELFNSAVENVNNYEMEEAQKKVETILRNENAPGRLKYKSFFIQGFIHNFNEDSQAAEQTFINLIDSSLSERYSITTLPENIAQNPQLIGIYNRAKQRYKKEAGISYKSIAKMVERAHILAEEIKKINEIILSTRRQFISSLYKLAKSYYEKEDFIKAAYKAALVLQYNPSNQMAKYIYDTSVDRLSSFFPNAGEKENTLFQKAVKNYIEGSYSSAIRRFKKIRDIAPRKIDVLISDSHILQASQADNRRAQKLLKEAKKAADRKYYMKAEEKLLSSLALDKYNMHAAILLEEVKYLQNLQ